MQNSNSYDSQSIGAVFTPISWAKWMMKEFHVVEEWVKGATVLDPTAGTGHLLTAIMLHARDLGIEVTDEMAARLIGIEINPKFVEEFKNKNLYPELPLSRVNMMTSDFFEVDSKIKADIIVGNPPWINFNDLEAAHKERLKPLFHKYGLVKNRQHLLLGKARVDLAALVISKSIHDHLNPNGKAHFFMPLSILLNDGAHEGFRSYKIGDVNFGIQEIFDFGSESVFEGIATRYCCTSFKRDVRQHFPISYQTYCDHVWSKSDAAPLDGKSGALSTRWESKKFIIDVAQSSFPRQGVNSCGAKEIFIFDAVEPLDNSLCYAYNSTVGRVLLPSEYVYPLLGRDQFRSISKPMRYVLLPHDRLTGKPLSRLEMSRQFPLQSYLNEHKDRLISRKGVLINSWINKGMWWALIGVGNYSFAPFKVFWESLGRKIFEPILMDDSQGIWQGNQALHAFMPFETIDEAARVFEELKNPEITEMLLGHGMAGTCNWAQPGRIKQMLSAKELVWDNQELIAFDI